ncbi:MAG: hypothetical protein AAF512_06745 [Pseudomonadota bacterium]
MNLRLIRMLFVSFLLLPGFVGAQDDIAATGGSAANDEKPEDD